MSFKFFNIGKANAEVDRLEAEVARLTSELQSAQENAGAVEKGAEELRSSLLEASKANATKDAEIARLNGLVAGKDTELATTKAELAKANEKLANPSAQIQQAASVKAAEITAAQGQPPVKASPVENPSKQEAKPELKGFAKARAAFKAELSK